ncbi:hypothetical protein C8R46DRAFT_1268650 [Mycena filopes]|nr:hypothetical protein C8R46DRAFT_1268650 [Mycena filopes]
MSGCAHPFHQDCPFSPQHSRTIARRRLDRFHDDLNPTRCIHAPSPVVPVGVPSRPMTPILLHRGYAHGQRGELPDCPSASTQATILTTRALNLVAILSKLTTRALLLANLPSTNPYPPDHSDGLLSRGPHRARPRGDGMRSRTVAATDTAHLADRWHPEPPDRGPPAAIWYAPEILQHHSTTAPATLSRPSDHDMPRRIVVAAIAETAISTRGSLAGGYSGGRVQQLPWRQEPRWSLFFVSLRRHIDASGLILDEPTSAHFRLAPVPRHNERTLWFPTPRRACITGRARIALVPRSRSMQITETILAYKRAQHTR